MKEKVQNIRVLAPKGLPNLGNTCFFNSALQCLLSTHQLRYYLNNAAHDFVLHVPACTVSVYDEKVQLEEADIPVTFQKDSKTTFIYVFKKFITEFYTDRSPNPRPVFDQVSKRASRFRGWHQQDSHELLRYMIDGLRQEEVDAIARSVKEYLKENGKTDDAVGRLKLACMKFAKPVLDRVFCGSLLQTVRCSECEHDSECFEPFLDLSLSIPRDSDSNSQHKNSPKAVKTLEDALKRFTELEQLKGINSFECEKCCVSINKEEGKRVKTVEADKHYLLYSLPPVLTLHLKRFEKIQHYNRVQTRKLSDHVEFPLILDVAPYCCERTEELLKGQQKILYSLHGIVVHSGSLSGGHYIAYVKSRQPIEHVQKFFDQTSYFDASAVGSFVEYEKTRSDKWAKRQLEADSMDEESAYGALTKSNWYYCSDSQVTRAEESRVLSAEAYLLFYERFY